jgi:uncharacterized protein YdeI (YjbR/CyaY-like superfamily)
MENPNTLYLSDRRAWRAWLETHFDKEKEIWLVYPHKASRRPGIAYNDAVEEALCFGWIDSTVRSLDESSSVQRFSPRKPKSSYSQPNKERLKWLYENDLLHPSIKEGVKKIISEAFVFPQDIIDAIQNDAAAWAYYQTFSLAYRRIRIAYIDAARNRPEEFQKRLNNFIAKTRENKRIGFGGIEKYC